MLSLENNGNNNYRTVYGPLISLSVDDLKAKSQQLIYAAQDINELKTRELIEALEINDVFVPQEESNHRIQVLNELNYLVKRWMISVTIMRNVSPDSVRRCKIFTFGSYKLGVHSRHSDTDVLCVAPRHITRADFFTSFYQLLQDQPEIKELRALEEAYVPVIKMKFNNVEIDMVFARLDLDEISEYQNLRSPRILKKLDPKCAISLSGYRVTDQIIRLVPNVENFRLVLRAIKLWARRKGIYSSITGYLGGVSWAILVAWVCRYYPRATSVTLIEEFFYHFSTWDWPKPVTIREPETHVVGPDIKLPSWNPEVNVLDRVHLMPIITPTYPQQNSSFNVSQSTRGVIQKALCDGYRTVDDIKRGLASWSDLFEPFNFFEEYVHYVALFVNSWSDENQLSWNGFVESKIRHLTATLETNPSIMLARLNPEPIQPENSKYEVEKYCSVWFIGLVFIKFGTSQTVDVDLTSCIQTFIDTTKRQAEQINLLSDDMTLQAKYVKKKDLHNIVPNYLIFKKKNKKKNVF